MKKLLTIGLVSAVCLGASAASAQASTLGISIPPAGSTLGNCPSPTGVYAQAQSDPTTPYSVPEAGTITQWQTITPDDASGEDVTLLVLKPVGAAFNVVAVDPRTIDDPAPDVSTFTLATPITVSGGETFGLWSPDFDPVCYFNGGSTPLGNHLAGLAEPSPPPAAGQTLNRAIGDSPSGYTLNLAANFVPASTPTPTPTPTPHKKKCKKKKHKRSAESAKKKKCKKKKKR